MELQNNDIREEESTIEKERFKRSNISLELHEIYERVRVALEHREVTTNFVQFSAAVAECLPADFEEKFVEKLTPPAWVLKNLMADPEHMKEFIKLAAKLNKAK